MHWMWHSFVLFFIKPGYTILLQLKFVFERASTFQYLPKSLFPWRLAIVNSSSPRDKLKSSNTALSNFCLWQRDQWCVCRSTMPFARLQELKMRLSSWNIFIANTQYGWEIARNWRYPSCVLGWWCANYRKATSDAGGISYGTWESTARKIQRSQWSD